MFTDDLFRYLLQNCLIYLCTISPYILAEDGENSYAHLEEIYREHLIPDLGGKIPSGAFDWTRLIFNNLDSRGISIPDGIPSSDRLSDGRSDETRLILTSDSKYASEIPSTYIMRSPVKFSLFPNPEEKPEYATETDNNDESPEDNSDDPDFTEWNADTETCKASLNCKNNPVGNGEPEQDDNENKKDHDEVYLNNYDPLEHPEEPHLLSRHRKPPFMKNSEDTERQNDEDENKNLHYEFPRHPPTTTRFLPSNNPTWRTNKVVAYPFPIPSHLPHRHFHHQLALNYILANLGKQSSPQQRGLINDHSAPASQKPSLMAVVFTPAIKTAPKKVKRNSGQNGLREFLTF